MKFLVITAFCDRGDRYRRRNLTATLANNMKVFPEATFCVAEQNPTGWFDTLHMDSARVHHIGISIEGGFRKTVLLNAAVKYETSIDTIVMVDGDVFLIPEVVNYIRSHWGDGSLVFPYSEAIYLKETDSRRLISGMSILPGPKDHGACINRQTGLCNVFTRKTWELVGGYDEEFMNWGAEDDAFLTKCKRLVGPVSRNGESGCIAYHLFHPVTNTAAYMKGNRDYIDNRIRQACIKRMCDDDLKLYVSGKARLSEMIDKYSKLGKLEIDLNWQCTPDACIHIDTTIHDVDRTGMMTFAKVLTAIEAEEGTDYCIQYIDNILMRLPGLTTEQRDEIIELRKLYEGVEDAI